jgi:uncharacterized membrane protein YgcG
MGLRDLLTPLVIATAVALFPHTAAHAGKAIIPAGHERVVDTTGTLTPGQKAELARMSEAIDKESRVVVLTLMVPSLNGEESIEEFGIRAAETLTPGHNSESGSAILLIARSEHKVRIEVNRFLGQTLTDAKARHLIDTFKPQLMTGDYNGAIKLFYSGIRPYVGRTPGDGADVRQATANPQPAAPAEQARPVYDFFRKALGMAALFIVVAALVPSQSKRKQANKRKPTAPQSTVAPGTPSDTDMAGATGAAAAARAGPKRRRRRNQESKTASGFWSWGGVSWGSTPSSDSGSTDSTDSTSNSGSGSSFDGGGSSSSY